MNEFSSAAMQVPVGFRFHPTDEELVGYYLHGKVMAAPGAESSNNKSELDIIRDLDLYKLEPWDLHALCKIGDAADSSTKHTDWYFFSHKDRKYPTGNRANRATAAGFWKATGRDKPILCTKLQLIGMRKTLVFYKGRAPHGEKTDWIMHEFRLDGSLADMTPCEDGSWVVCRVFRKTKNFKDKTHMDNRMADSLEPEQVSLQQQVQAGRLSNSRLAAADIQLSSDGGGEGAAAGVRESYLPEYNHDHNHHNLQYSLCKHEINRLAEDYSRYHEMGEPVDPAHAFPHPQQLAESIQNFKTAHDGYNMSSNPSSSCSSFRSGQLLLQGKKLDHDCSSSSSSYMMPQFAASASCVANGFESETRSNMICSQGTTSTTSGCAQLVSNDVESIDWMFEAQGAPSVEPRVHMMRSIPSTTCTLRDQSLGDVTIHLQVKSRQSSDHFSSSSGHHEIDDFWNFTENEAGRRSV